MNLTINRLLHQERTKSLKLLAGVSGHNNIIQNVNIMDNPEPLDWIMPGDFIITTGFIFKDQPTFQRQIVKELSEMNCAALAVKTRKYFGKMPQALIEAADEFQLPLLEIPINYTLSELSTILNRELMTTQNNIIEETLSIHEKFTDITLSGGGIQEITKEISNLVQNPIIIVSIDWKLLAVSEQEKNKYKLKDYIEIKDNILFNETLKENIPEDARNFKKSIKRKLQLKDKEIICRVVPIKASEEILGYIIVWETVSKMTKLNYIVIEKAAMAIALELLKKEEINEVKRRIRHNFLENLLNEHIENPESLSNLAGMYGMEVKSNYVCIVCQLNGFSDHPFDTDEEVIYKKRKLTEATQSIFIESKKIQREQNDFALHFERGRQIVIFYLVKDDYSLQDIENKTRDFSKKLNEIISLKIADINLMIGIGGSPYSLLELNKSYKEAEKAISLNKRLNNKENQASVIHYNDYLIYELLVHQEIESKLEKYYQSTLQDLIVYDKNNHTELTNTLEIYFRSHENIERASKELFIHRNTLVYRLKQIEEILKKDLKNYEDIFALQLGFYIERALHLL